MASRQGGSQRGFIYDLILVLAVGILVLAEAALRVLGLAAPQSEFYFPRGYLRADAGLAFAPTPGFSFSRQGVLFANNSLGMRDAEPPVDRPADSLRLLAVGDSQTWGANLGIGLTYPRVLARGWRGPGRIVPLLGGVPGYASDQAVPRAAQLGLRLRPDLIVLGVYVDSGSGELPRLLAHQRFGRYIVVRGWLLPADMARRATQSAWGRLFYGLYLPLRARSHLLSLLLDRKAGLLRNRQFFLPISGPNDPAWPKSFDMLTEDLREFQQLCRRLGSRPVVLLIPSARGLVLGDPVDDLTRQRTLAYCRSQGLPALDLHEAFVRADPRRVPLYFADAHLSPLGHALIARELESFLRSRYFGEK